MTRQQDCIRALKARQWVATGLMHLSRQEQTLTVRHNTCALQLSNAGMMVRLASLPRVVSCHMPHSCSSHRTQASPDNKSTGRCNHDRCCTEHWERVGTRAGSASQSNGSDNSCGLSSTDLGDRDSRANTGMTTLEMAEEDMGLAQSLGSSLLGADLALDFAGTQRAPSITAESPVSLVRRLRQKLQSTSVSDA
jgi:hypothetical protein